jgi:hypothetical protein
MGVLGGVATPPNLTAFRKRSNEFGIIRKKAHGAIAAYIRDDHAVACLGQQRSDLAIALNVIGPPVQKYNRPTIAGADLSVSDVQDAGVDLLEAPNSDMDCLQLDSH